MTVPARIPCCISGCGRTFKRTVDDSGGELICGRHWRGVKMHAPTLARLHMETRRALTAFMRRHGDPDNLSPKQLRLFLAYYRRHERRWTAVVKQAQFMQDAGFFAPKPRCRANLPTCAETQTSGLSTRFEDQFQRMKRAQVHT